MTSFPPTAAILTLLLLFHPSSSSLYSSLWCSGSHPESRHCTFNNLCYSSRHNEFIFLRDKARSTFSGILDSDETKELLRIPPSRKNLHFSMFKSQEGDSLITGREPHSLVLIHVNSLPKSSLFPDLALPIWRTLSRLCTGGEIALSQCSFSGIILEYEEGPLHPKSKDLLEQLFGQIHELHLSSRDGGSIICYDKLHVGYLEESYSAESFRDFVLDRLEVKIPSRRTKVILGTLDFPSEYLDKLCPDCEKKENVLHLTEDNPRESLASLSSAGVVVCQDNCLVAGLLMPQDSILIYVLRPEETEEPSVDLMNLLKNRESSLELRLWSPSESFPSSIYKDEDNEYDERLWIYPSRITNFECSLAIKSSELRLNLSWDPPLNAQYFNSLSYELFLQGMVSKDDDDDDLQFLEQFSVKTRSASLAVNIKLYSAVKVYILAKVPLQEGFENKGIDGDFICDLDKDIHFS